MDPQRHINEGDLSNQQIRISQQSVQNKEFDRRTYIENLQHLPYSSICQIKSYSVKDQQKKWHGTGFLISKNLILTCAHNLYHHAQQDYRYQFQFDRVQLIFGQNPNQLRYEIYKQNFHFPERYKTSFDSKRYDYGIITIPEKLIPEKINSQALPLKFTDHSVDNGIKFGLVAGFPSFIYGSEDGQNRISHHIKNHQMYQDLDIFQIRKYQYDSFNPNPYDLIYHRIDTSKGQSGSPFFNYNPTNGKLQVIGIHIEGFSQNAVEEQKENIAVLLNNEILDFLKENNYSYQPGQISQGILNETRETNQKLVQINYCGLLKNLDNKKKKQAIQTIFKLENIRFLNLNGNLIESEVSGSVGNLKRLILLQLEQNRITEMPEQIRNLKNLKYLKLKNNLIKKMPLIWDLGCLREIDLSHNQLKGKVEFNKYEVKDWFCHLLPINLRKINIGNNPIKILVFDQQIQWKNLQQIRAQNCGIGKIEFGSCLLGPKVHLKGNKLQSDEKFLQFLKDNEHQVELDELAMNKIDD